MSGAILYTQGFGSRPENVEVPLCSRRSPNSTDLDYPLGKRWINSDLSQEFVLTSKTSFNGSTSANWSLLAGSALYIAGVGSSTLAGGTVTVSNPLVLSTSYILISRTNQINTSVLQVLNITNGSFNVTSFSGTDGSSFVYMIVN